MIEIVSNTALVLIPLKVLSVNEPNIPIKKPINVDTTHSKIKLPTILRKVM